jgi:hypothetical protein
MSDDTWVGKDLPVGSVTPKNPTRLDKARMFLQFRVADALSAEEVREVSFQNLSSSMVTKHCDSLEALEWLANETPKGVSLTEIVQWDANYVINSGTDEQKYPERAEEEARVWMLEFAEFVRDILGDHAPHRTYPKPVFKERKYFFPGS